MNLSQSTVRVPDLRSASLIPPRLFLLQSVKFALVLLATLWLATPGLAQDAKADDAKADDAKADDAKTGDANPEEVKVSQDETTESSGDAKEDEDGDTVDEILAGHSAHGEVFNEGPRQKAYLMGTTGEVSFPVTTESEEAQAFINQGIGQLHGFWYLEAERSFRQAAALDPDCAIAYWGCALANRTKRERAQGFMKEAMDRLDGVTDREKAYIEALSKFFEADPKEKRKRAEAYTKSLEDICLDYPEDLEARAFLALQIYANRSADLPIGSYLAADALMKQIFEVDPDHPTHHFNIHVWDLRKPEMALQSAAMCGPAAPGIAHMWHMPGHIYSRLKRYEDAVWQQEASARVDHAHMMRDQVMPDEISNFAHNNEWLIRNLIFIGRVQDALDLARNMTELPRHPKYNTLSNRRGSTRFGRERLFDVLTKYQLWDDAIALCHADYLEPTDSKSQQQLRQRLLGAAYFMSGKETQGEQLLTELRNERDEIESSRETKIAEARAKVEKEEQEKADAEEADSEDSDAETSDAEASDTEKADTEKADTEKADTEKADTEKADSSDAADADDPADENDVTAETDAQESEAVKKAIESVNKEIDGKLKQLDKTLQAIEGYQKFAAGDAEGAYELFKKTNTENKGFVIEARFESGDVEEALKEAREQVKRRRNEVLPLALLTFLLHKDGQLEEAKETMESLRAISGSIDMTSTVFTRLTPIAVELGFPEDWRVPSKLADDIGERFALSELGPFRWSPSMATEFELPNASGELFSSKQLQGQPTILIFYLGYGCLHCAEQLHAFAPRMKDFEDAGIKIMAISTDDIEGLHQSIADYDEGLPIPLLSDGSLDTFKAFRAFDDFENVPLHGTFLIDEDGLIRWQDISYEPFMDHEFLLNESQRLLAQEKKAFVSEEAETTAKTEHDAAAPAGE